MPSDNVCWGLDVGAGAIKAIKLERDGDTLTVGDFVVIPHKRVLSTPELDETDALRVALGVLTAEYGESMRGQRIAVSMPGNGAFIRFAKLPPVAPKDVANLVRFEAAQQMPFPIDEVEWDYQTFTSQDTPDIEVGIFAITSQKIGEKLSLYGDVGLSPDIFTIGPLAAYNAVAYDLAFTEQTPGTIIVDIGAVSTDLIIADAGRVWIRTFPVGGHHFTMRLAEEFKLTYSKAEKLKREAETSKYKRHIFQAFRPVFGDLVQEIQRSIGFYQDTHPGAKLTRLIGLGSTFRVMGLRKLLAQQLRLEVFRMESFKRLSVDGAGAADFEAAALNLATAYGLALQGLGLTPIRANLMPVSVLRKAVWKRKTPWFIAAASLGVIGAGATFLRPFMDGQNYKPGSIAGDSVISSVISKGTQLKNEWQRIADENQPKFPTENVRSLFDRRVVHHHILKDVEEMLAFADSKRPSPGRAFRMHELQTRFLAPGTPMPKSGSAETQPLDVPPEDDGSGEESGATDPNAAGPMGAILVELTVDSTSAGDDTFFNDSVLAWLRKGLDPMSRPYTLVAAPRIEDVTRRPVVEAFGPGGPAGRPTPPPQGPRGGSRGQPMPGAAGGEDSGRGTAAELNELAPLPTTDPVQPAANATRYTVRWVIQLLPAPPGLAPPPGDDGSEAESDQVSHAPAARREDGDA
jgi:type IV pilus assembly protein PilM